MEKREVTWHGNDFSLLSFQVSPLPLHRKKNIRKEEGARQRVTSSSCYAMLLLDWEAGIASRGEVRWDEVSVLLFFPKPNRWGRAWAWRKSARGVCNCHGWIWCISWREPIMTRSVGKKVGRGSTMGHGWEKTRRRFWISKQTSLKVHYSEVTK